jgi:hypothetical protein
MTYGDDSIQLPDGEELVVVERDEWPVAESAPDPREASLNLRRQVGQPLRTHPSPIATTS